MRFPAEKSGLITGLALLLLLALIGGSAGSPARAAEADVAMFYDSLTPYGNWVDYGNYGPVWYPTQGVTPNWRPYMDGRWVPTTDGWVFETGEPWGWATYHWGNWMPTTEYGWVWYPGSTWYPSTVAWRSSPEDTPVDNSYIGWAPIPPPDFVPEPAYYPGAGYPGGGYYPGGYPGGGYYPGAPLADLLTAPFWIFAQAANFLLGFNQPFLPSYSYYNCGCLSPYNYTPVLFPLTNFNNDFCFFPFNNRAFFAFGPPFPFVSRVTNINIVNINNFARNANFNHFRNVLPTNAVLNRHPFIREAFPAQIREGRGLQLQRVKNPATVARHLANPGVTPPPHDVPKLTKEIPKGVAPQVQPGVRGRAGERVPVAPRGRTAPREVTTPRGEAAPRVTAPKGEAGPRGVTAPKGKAAPRAPREAPHVTTAPGRERPPAHEMRAPVRPPTGEFRAPGRERVTPPLEFRAPSRGTIMPPPSTHEITPRMQGEMRQFRAPSRPAPSFRPSAPPPAPRMAPPAPAPRMAPAPTPHMAPSAPAPRPSAPAPGPGPMPHGGGGRGGEHHR